ncbi:MAG: NAD(P)-dependent alcohol dehydrogenase [Paludibacter sp.]|jgi:NADPH:quinone reductase-like Zn-dependent oxidoreductase|nr:NAD(P)-dependent alcohol dehydrogenase [Paludibacter sp.]
MKAVIFDKKRSSENLSYNEVEKPIPAENELLVQVYAASINAADYRMLQLGFPPKKKIFGADVAGIVESAGKNIKNFKPGDRVIGELSDVGFGGFAEYVCASENAFVRKPEELTFENAAALPLAATTALQALRNKGNIEKGSQVLIIGSSGGVGSYAVQIAKYYGAMVTGICNSKNEKQARLMGADQVIDYNKVKLSQIDGKYDLIVGINGSYSLRTCKRLLKPNGNYIMVGGSLSHIFKSILFGWMLSFGSKKISFLTAKSNIDDLKFIVQLAKEGKIKPVIDRSFSLSETAEAFQYIREKHAKGKVIIKIAKEQ